MMNADMHQANLQKLQDELSNLQMLTKKLNAINIMKSLLQEVESAPPNSIHLTERRTANGDYFLSAVGERFQFLVVSEESRLIDITDQLSSLLGMNETTST